LKKHLDAVFGAHRGSFKYDDIDHLIDDLPLFIKEDFEEIKGVVSDIQKRINRFKNEK